MGQVQSCNCRHHTELFNELVLDPIKPIPEQVIETIPEPQVVQIQGTNGQLKVRQVVAEPQIKVLEISKIKSKILEAQIVNQKSLTEGSLSQKDFIIPEKITQALSMLGDFEIDIKLLDMFKDCPEQETTELNDKGEFYLGQVSHGIRTGYGKVLYFDESYYEGFWFNNERQFYGRFVDKDGDAYIGEWFANQMHGKGKFVQGNGQVFSTIYGLSSQAELRAEYIEKGPSKTYEDGKLYYGELTSNNKRTGLGLQIWPDKTEYFGHYSDDKQTGYGTMNYEDGKNYEGQWANGKMHGLGILKWPNNQLFIGLFEDDIKQGYGMFVWPDGKKYRGQFLNGTMNGLGRITDLKGRVLEAEWVDGKRVKECITPNSTQNKDDIDSLKSQRLVNSTENQDQDKERKQDQKQVSGKQLLSGKQVESDPKLIEFSQDEGIPQNQKDQFGGPLVDAQLQSNKQTDDKKKF